MVPGIGVGRADILKCHWMNWNLRSSASFMSVSSKNIRCSSAVVSSKHT